MHQILREFDKGNRDGYNTIIEQLADVELDHRKLNKIINEIAESAPLFHKSHSTLVKSLLDCNWPTTHAVTVANWKRSVISLVTANTVHLQQVLAHCVKRIVFGM